MPPADSPAAYCPDCDHLLDDDALVKRIGRHMDGIDPTFRCPVCDGETTHPSRAPEATPVYGGRRSPTRAGETTAYDVDEESSDPHEVSEEVVVADGHPPIDLGDVKEGDRVSIHYDEPGREVRQTKVGTVTRVDRATEGSASSIVFEADTGRVYRFDPSGEGGLSASGDSLGRVVRVRVTR